MTKTEIKQNLHTLIDNVEDENKLEEIMELVDNVVNENTISWDSLSKEERDSIERGLEDIEKGNTISYEEFRKKHAKWFAK